MGLVAPLMKYVVAPAAGSAAIGGGIAAAPAAMDLFSGKSGRKAMDAIISTQDPLGDDGYDIGIKDQVLNLFRSDKDKVTGENISARKDLRNLKEITDDDVFSNTLGRLGYTPKKGDTISGLKAKFGKEIQELANKDALTAAITQARGLAEYERSTPEYLKEQRLADEARQYRYYQDAESRKRDERERLDRRRSEQDALDYKMADLAARKQIAQDNYNLEVQKMNRQASLDKKAKIAQALAGLGNLGMLFAI